MLPRTVILYREIFCLFSKQNGPFSWTSEVNGTSSLLCCAVWCLTLCDPTDCSQPSASVPWGFSRQEYWSGLPCPPPGDLPNPGIELRSHALQVESFSHNINNSGDDAPKAYLPGSITQLFLCKLLVRGVTWCRQRGTSGSEDVAWNTQLHCSPAPSALSVKWGKS